MSKNVGVDERHQLSPRVNAMISSVVSPLVAAPCIRSKRLGLTVGLAHTAQISATVVADLKIDLAARMDAERVANRLRDCHLTFARHCRRHLQAP